LSVLFKKKENLSRQNRNVSQSGKFDTFHVAVLHIERRIHSEPHLPDSFLADGSCFGAEAGPLLSFGLFQFERRLRFSLFIWATSRHSAINQYVPLLISKPRHELPLSRPGLNPLLWTHSSTHADAVRTWPRPHAARCLRRPLSLWLRSPRK
jgi:hypothetical protein